LAISHEEVWEAKREKSEKKTIKKERERKKIKIICLQAFNDKKFRSTTKLCFLFFSTTDVQAKKKFISNASLREKCVVIEYATFANKSEVKTEIC
jgi:hypothetical protein